MDLAILCRDDRKFLTMSKKENILSIRLNDEEKAELEYVKRIFGTSKQYGEDSRTLKLCVTFTKNVIHNLFGDKLAHCFKKETPKKRPAWVETFKEQEIL